MFSEPWRSTAIVVSVNKYLCCTAFIPIRNSQNFVNNNFACRSCHGFKSTTRLLSERRYRKFLLGISASQHFSYSGASPVGEGGRGWRRGSKTNKIHTWKNVAEQVYDKLYWRNWWNTEKTSAMEPKLCAWSTVRSDLLVCKPQFHYLWVLFLKHFSRGCFLDSLNQRQCQLSVLRNYSEFPFLSIQLRIQEFCIMKIRHNETYP